MELQKRAYQSIGASSHGASGCAGGSRGGGASARQMIVDLAGHALHLLDDTLRQFWVSRRSGAIGLLRQQCERSLEAVRKVARSCDGAFNGFLAIFEQRVQLVNQGLDFAWICAHDPPVLARTNSHQSFPQPPEGCQALAQSEESRGH